MKIKIDQMRRLEGLSYDLLAGRLLPYLRECHAQEIHGVPEDELRGRVVALIARARGHGLAREASIALFVGIGLHIGPRFDDHPAIRRVLEAGGRDPDARLAALAEETSRADWDEARSARHATGAAVAFMFDFSQWTSYGWPLAIALGVVACSVYFGAKLFAPAAPCPLAPPPPPPLTADPPVVPDRHYLTLDQVAQLLVVPPEITGAGRSVAIIDSGYFPHPYFTSRGFDVQGLPVTTVDGQVLAIPPDPFEDRSGHGTSMVANALAVAPGSEVTMVKGSFFNSALRTAILREPPFDVISISNCTSYEQLDPPYDPQRREEARAELAALIEQAEQRNIVIVCCAGNAGRHTILGSMPGVITVGGAYRDEGGELRASDYANASGQAPNRLPDVCGVCGPAPLGQYIMLPTAPGSGSDQFMSEHGDGTAPDDGWTLASGTSSATPQVAAICALMRQVNPNLTSAQIRHILQETARPVAAGQSHDGVPAAATWCLLPDATRATQAARPL